MANLQAVVEMAGPMQQILEQFEQIQPVLDELPVRFEEAETLLKAARAENLVLRQQLEQQRQVFLRMFAQGMGIPLEQVLSMESDMQNQIGSEDHAHETTRTDEEQA
jgi:hypothetical protein